MIGTIIPIGGVHDDRCNEGAPKVRLGPGASTQRSKPGDKRLRRTTVGWIFGLIGLAIAAQFGPQLIFQSRAAPSNANQFRPAQLVSKWNYDHGMEIFDPRMIDQVAALNPDAPLPPGGSTWVSSSLISENTVPMHQGETQESAFLQFHVSTLGKQKDYSASILTGVPVDCDEKHPVVARIDGGKPTNWGCSSTVAVVLENPKRILNEVQKASTIEMDLPRQNPERPVRFRFNVVGMKAESDWK